MNIRERHSKNILVIVGSILLSTISIYAAPVNSQSDSVKISQLKEVVVLGSGADENVKSTDMGKITISDKMILNMPVMFGEPDIVKTIQTLPGVSQGVEGFTGLYVRGGENDQNIFLYQGLPLYQVSHLGGIFSSFNVSSIRNMEFYKSSFPAKYGGRISSITDISTRQGEFEKFKGKLNVGLLCANIYVSGPIIKNKTSYSVGLRRSWMDIITLPALAIMNSVNKKNGKKYIFNYSFTDFNAALTHKFNENTVLSLTGYYGNDRLKIGQREFETKQYSGTDNAFFNQNKNNLSWGNWGVIADFIHKWNKGEIEGNIYYSRYSSSYLQENEFQTDMKDKDTYGFVKDKTKNSIEDLGIRFSYTGLFASFYTLTAGWEYIHHNYLPSYITNTSFKSGNTLTDSSTREFIKANEAAIYADNNFLIGSIASVSVGLRGVLYQIYNRQYYDVEPRASFRISINDNYSVKAGYSRMSQYVQQLSSNYINLPTDLWQPMARDAAPMKSDQYSVGFYGKLPYWMYFSVEGWYKSMKGIADYREGVTILNMDLDWQQKITYGKGWAYGMDIMLTKEAGKFTGSIGYGLMWNRRKFADLNQGKKFPAKFDNRHKININVSYKLNKKIEFNVGWQYITGNRLTIAIFNNDIPNNKFPDAPYPGQPAGGWSDNEGVGYYSTRNNVRVPASHRLDLGMNLYHFYKNGNVGMWNFSLYNAYCHMNAMTITRKDSILGSNNNTYYTKVFKTLSIIPIIPSVSYTYNF